MPDPVAPPSVSSLPFEKLGLFYLGKRFDAASGRTTDELVLYDSRDLVTHAVCIGMTGSGKTGLGIGLIEEAALDGIPVIAIDPKGDLGNLLLTFPDLTADTFRPWVNEDDARRAGLDADAFAAREAEGWRSGLTAWGQDGARVQRLRSAADFVIYTPGSRAGRQVSILSSFAAPGPRELEDGELMAERAAGTATSALVLAGVDAPPRSREHTLLATLLTHAWQSGRSLDLGALVRQVQSPPFDRVGVVDLESFYPAKDRFELAMRLNGVLAAPGFEAWLSGDPLDPQALFYTAAGRPRVVIFSIAHLGDAERMFFVSLLMNAMVAWMRRQTGTTSLRALLYMDEILGYFPPVANPPSKGPLLTLLKQGRAFGLGTVLATQNPVDLDYKGLANTGTWFLGRLQTERDKARVLDGLEGIGGPLDRAEADRLLSGLRKRVFLMHNVHEPQPTLFETRWTLSYLRGPLSRDQIRTLTAEERPPDPAALPQLAAAAASASSGSPAPTGGASHDAHLALERPVLPPGIEEFFIPPRPASAPSRYVAGVIGAARVSFVERKLNVDATEELLYFAPVNEGAVEVEWADARRLDLPSRDLCREPDPRFAFAPLAPAASQPKKYAGWQKAFARWVAESQRLELLREPSVGLTSAPGESERDFRIRVQHETRSARDAALAAVRRKYAPKQAALAERLRRAEQAVQREQQQASDSKMQAAVSMGATLLGALIGRKTVNASTLGRATTAARGVGRTMKEAADVKRAGETVDSVRAAVAALEGQLAEDVAAVTARFDTEAPLDRITLAPKRGQVQVQFVALGWCPEQG